MNKIEMSVIILAGGASSRMGQNKALMKLGEKTMIERVVEPLSNLFQEIIIITDTPEDYEFLKEVKFARDAIIMDKKNSLLGIYSGLIVAKYSCVFAIACDMPNINIRLIQQMIDEYKEEDILIPFINPHYEPLHALYNKSCIPLMKKFLENNCYKIIDLLKQLDVKLIEKETILKFDPLMLCFNNVNTYEEYIQINKIFEKD